MVAAVDNFDLSGLSQAVSRIEHAISWNDADPQCDEYGDGDDEFYEDDVEWHTGNCDDELEDSAYTLIWKSLPCFLYFSFLPSPNPPDSKVVLPLEPWLQAAAWRHGVSGFPSNS